MKTYTPHGHLQSETFTHRILIQDWLGTVIRKNYEPVNIFSFLNEVGKYFDRTVPEYPGGIILPETTQRGWCHKNNLQYADLLMRKCPEIITDFKFVTGFWALKAKTGRTTLEERYFIGAHSFMTYKGLTLDCTALNHPSHHDFDIDQYFGVSFEVLDVLIAFEKAELEGTDLSKVPVIEVLQDTPYSKE